MGANTIKYGQTYTPDYSSEDMLFNAGLLDVPEITQEMTYLFGKDTNDFSLTMLTKGNGSISRKTPKKLNSTQYTYPVMGRIDLTTEILGLVDATQTTPGLGHGTFEVYTKDDRMIEQFGLSTADGQHTLRVQGTPIKVGINRYKNVLQLSTGDASEYVSLDNFVEGKFWSLRAPSVAAKLSEGTRAIVQTPGEMTNQYGYYRFSKPITGNISNKTVNVTFNTEGGGTTNKWMPEEMRQFEYMKMVMIEDKLWSAKYNADSNGVVHLTDPVTNLPIPEGAGVKDQLIMSGQYTTYSTLTLQMLDNIITRAALNRSSEETYPMELVFYSGRGGLGEINSAIKLAAQGNNYYTALGAEEIQSGGEYLSYGKYFNQYKTIDGHIITFKESGFFNNGLAAKNDIKNGDLINGIPRSAYDICLLDQSRSTKNSSKRNIEFVCEDGRENITGIYKGLTPLPESWGVSGNQLSGTRDEASYEVMISAGINIYDTNGCFYMSKE